MTALNSIAIVDPVGAKAGMDWYGLQLLRSLSRKGWQTCFLSNIDDKDDSVSVMNVFNNASDRGIKSLYKILTGLFKARKILIRKKIQVVVLHVFRSDWLELLFSLVFYHAGFRVCLIIHDIESLDTKKNTRVRKWILSRFHHYKVVHNDYSKQELIASIPEKDTANLYVIPHGDFTEMIERFPSDEQAVKFNPYLKSRINLLFFGQIKKAKGLDILLKAMMPLDDSFKLTVAGKARDESVTRYSGLTDELKKKDRIEIINRHLSDSERDFLIRHCDAVILPYRQIYQSGVLLMAMSYGKPVIASDVPAFKEIITDGKNGLLFEKNNPESLTSAINRLKSTDLQQLGMAGKRYVMENFNWNKIASLYMQMLGA